MTGKDPEEAGARLERVFSDFTLPAGADTSLNKRRLRKVVIGQSLQSLFSHEW